MNQTNIVGNFIRLEREKKGLSQKALGLLLSPAVTTQFISNIERGVTPLPANHIQNIAQIFGIQEELLISVCEKEFALKIYEQLGKSKVSNEISGQAVFVSNQNFDFIKKFIQSFENASVEDKNKITQSLENII